MVAVKTITIYEIFNPDSDPPQQAFEPNHERAQLVRRQWLHAAPNCRIWINKHIVPANRVGLCRALTTLPYRVGTTMVPSSD